MLKVKRYILVIDPEASLLALQYCKFRPVSGIAVFCEDNAGYIQRHFFQRQVQITGEIRLNIYYKYTAE